MNWFKRLVNSKIQINVMVVDKNESPPLTAVKLTTPKVINTNITTIRREGKSNYRFASDVKTDCSGNVTIFYYTEEHINGQWIWLSNTGSLNKNHAMKLHLDVLENGTIEPTEEKVILWQGLGKEETKEWVALQTKGE